LDANEVYLCARALIDGETIVVCQSNNSTEFRNLGNNLWEITIWPQQFFNTQPGQEISEIYINVTNEAGDIVVRDPETGEDFIIVPDCPN